MTAPAFITSRCSISYRTHSKIRFVCPSSTADGEPILGMQKFINTDSVLKKLFGTGGQADWVIAPNTNPEGSATTSGAKHHGAFDDDKPTVLATLARVLNKGKAASPALAFKASGQRNRATRRNIDQMSDFSLTREKGRKVETRAAFQPPMPLEEAPPCVLSRVRVASKTAKYPREAL